MIEFLTMGNITKDFNRLGIPVRQTYNGKDYGVCEVTDEEFKIMLEEPDDIEGTWEDCGWRHCNGSNQGNTNSTLIIKGKELKCWYTPWADDEETEDKDNESYLPKYNNLLTYLCDEVGVSQPRNVCALAKDLSKYNDITMAQLFKTYQG